MVSGHVLGRQEPPPVFPALSHLAKLKIHLDKATFRIELGALPSLAALEVTGRGHLGLSGGSENGGSGGGALLPLRTLRLTLKSTWSTATVDFWRLTRLEEAAVYVEGSLAGAATIHAAAALRALHLGPWAMPAGVQSCTASHWASPGARSCCAVPRPPSASSPWPVATPRRWQTPLVAWPSCLWVM